jgi:hypothetical protein
MVMALPKGWTEDIAAGALRMGDFSIRTRGLYGTRVVTQLTKAEGPDFGKDQTDPYFQMRSMYIYLVAFVSKGDQRLTEEVIDNELVLEEVRSLSEGVAYFLSQNPVQE